jgi:hypothetical protein
VIKRHAPPQVSVVTMDEVPEPPMTGRTSVAEDMYRQLRSLKAASAVKAEFANEKHGDYVKAKLKKMAKADKLFLSASRSADGRATSGSKSFKQKSL